MQTNKFYIMYILNLDSISCENNYIMRRLLSSTCTLNESRKIEVLAEDLAAAWLVHSCGWNMTVSKRREERKTLGCEDVGLKESVLLSWGKIALLTWRVFIVILQWGTVRLERFFKERCIKVKHLKKFLLWNYVFVVMQYEKSQHSWQDRNVI